MPKSQAVDTTKKLRSPQKPHQESPNPSAPKRLRGKQPETDQAALIKQLQEAWLGWKFLFRLLGWFWILIFNMFQTNPLVVLSY